MKARTKIRLSLLGILVLTVLAGVVDYPKGPDISFGDTFREIKVHLGLDLQGGTSLLYKADVSQIDETERTSALEGVRDVIERRINAFGVGEPNIQTVRSGDEWRVLVELPGVTDITEAINRIGETPLLEFKTEGEPPELTDEEREKVREENKKIKKQANTVLKKAQKADADFAALATEYSDDPGSAEQGGDLGEFSQGMMVDEFDDVVFTKAEVGVVYPELVETLFGYHIIRVDELREEPANNEEGTEVGKIARAHHILFVKESEQPLLLEPTYESTPLTGEQLENADVTFDPNTGLPTVSLQFNKEGRELFAQITKDNVGKTVAIYLDGVVISAPVVQQEITGGEAVISGNFTLEESKLLAQRLNAGALPVPVELISQQNVGPTLGQASIERSLFAGIFGLVLLSIFMIVYYRLPGVMSVLALTIYSLVVLAVFKLFPVTLTLAGIAGFILSIGMAVDANVLIFERFKEELRRGKPIGQSIDDGFKRAWTSIRDSNVSSLITCLILYWFGSSLIRGFAVTLAIGILISMFSAITITRNLLGVIRLQNTWWYGINKRKKE
ncbi:MAG: protein translocase subunit SecD [Candidatus Kerfeldbacteria bacterium]